MCVNNGIAGEWQWRTGHAASSALRKRNALCVFKTEVPANGNGRQVTRPPPQSELRKRRAICVFITEVQAADSTVGANEGSATRSFKV